LQFTPKTVAELSIIPQQQHPLLSKVNDSTSSLQEYNESILDHPFVSPDAGTAYDHYIAELTRRGDWETLKKAGVDAFNAEYAMINSESRLRRSLSGGTTAPTSKF